MIVEAYIDSTDNLCLGEPDNPYYTGHIMTYSILKQYEVKQSDKSKLKQVIKLKEAGFTADEILELIKEI
jgi:hypothetical protein